MNLQMDNAEETTIAVIDAGGDSRIVFSAKRAVSDRPIILRQESFSEAVGWFPQSTIEMTRQEMVLLRSALGGSAHNACSRTALKLQVADKADEAQVVSIHRLPSAI